jgi:plastocyanin
VVIALCIVLLIGCGPTAEEKAELDREMDELADRIEAVAPKAPEEPKPVAPINELADEDVGYVRLNLRAVGDKYEPDSVEVELGDEVMLTVTSVDAGHGFALPDFGINERIPMEESETFTFTADKEGEFEFFNPVKSTDSWKEMKGTFIVR